MATTLAYETEKALGLISAGLGNLGQTKLAFNEKWYAEEKDLLTRKGRLEGVLFQEEDKGWQSACKDYEALGR